MSTLACPENLFTDSTLEKQCFPSSKDVTFGDVLAKLAKHCAPFQKLLTNGQRVEKVETVEMSATNGFTSHLYRCAITMLKAGNEGKKQHQPAEEFQLIVKVFSMERADVIMQSFIGKDNLDDFFKKHSATEQVPEAAGGENGFAGPYKFFAQMHRNECNFYDFIAPDAPIPLPKIYYTQHAHGPPSMQPGIILMEDLSHKAHLSSFVEGLNQEEVKAVVKHLSHLHAHLLATDAEGCWKKHFITSDQMFHNDNEAGDSTASAWIEGIQGQLSEAQRDAFLIPMKRLGKVLASMEYHIWCKKKLMEEYGISETLVHGDLWVNNLLWSNEEPNRVAAFIDWQLTVRGSPMVDVNRLLAMNTEPEVRYELEKEGNLLAFYLKSLNDKLAESGMKPVGYGVEELQHAYNLAMVGEALACVFVLPFFQKMWATEPDLELKLARIFRRASASLVDAIKALEKEAPEWLESEEKEEQKGKH